MPQDNMTLLRGVVQAPYPAQLFSGAIVRASRQLGGACKIGAVNRKQVPRAFQSSTDSDPIMTPSVRRQSATIHTWN